MSISKRQWGHMAKAVPMRTIGWRKYRQNRLVEAVSDTIPHGVPRTGANCFTTACGRPRVRLSAAQCDAVQTCCGATSSQHHYNVYVSPGAFQVAELAGSEPEAKHSPAFSPAAAAARPAAVATSSRPRWLGPFDAQVSHFTTIRGD